MKLMWAVIALLLSCWRANAITDPAVTTEPFLVINKTSAVLKCNLTDETLPVKGSHWTHNDKIIEGTKTESTSPYASYRLNTITYHQSGVYRCVFHTEPEVKGVIEVKTPPNVGAYKHSDHGNEHDKATLVCVGHGYPLLTDWSWFKEKDENTREVIINGTGTKYEIKSTPNKTMLTINDLNIENDAGFYICSGTNDLGTDSDKIHLRVRSHLAALWPFLGILAEVIILVTVIFIYEKRRKPDEVTDDDDSGSAPLKSNSTTNHKDKNVRQRNSN